MSEASDYYPPSLPLPPQTSRLPPIAQTLPGSSWTSDRCEVRPYGIFLSRLLTFGSPLVNGSGLNRSVGKYPTYHTATSSGTADCNWWEERLHYFTDPACRHSYFSVYGRGRYTIGSPVPAFGRDIAFEADFEVTKLKVTINDKRLLPVVESCVVNSSKKEPASRGKEQQNVAGFGLPNSRTSPEIETEPWMIGVERDVTASGGCSALNVHLPTTPIPQLLAVVRRGGPHDLMLLVGQQPMDPVDNAKHNDGADESEKQPRRPTSFYPGLRRCTSAEAPVAKLTGRREAEQSGPVKVSNRRLWRHVVSSSAPSVSGFGGYELLKYFVVSCVVSATVDLLPQRTKRLPMFIFGPTK